MFAYDFDTIFAGSEIELALFEDDGVVAADGPAVGVSGGEGAGGDGPADLLTNFVDAAHVIWREGELLLDLGPLGLGEGRGGEEGGGQEGEGEEEGLCGRHLRLMKISEDGALFTLLIVTSKEFRYYCAMEPRSGRICFTRFCKILKGLGLKEN